MSKEDDSPPDIGVHTLCLSVQDLAASRAFYEALGLEVYIDEPEHVNLNTGTTNVSLMKFLDGNCLNFRGGDVKAIHAWLKARFPELEGEPQTYEDSPGGAGACWMTRDPDGNAVFFDTAATDSRRHRVERLLAGVQRELDALDVTSTQFAAFRDELLERVPD